MADSSVNMKMTVEDSSEIEGTLNLNKLHLPSWLDRNADGMLDSPDSYLLNDSNLESDNEPETELSIFDDSFKSQSLDVFESVKEISFDSLVGDITKDSINERSINMSDEDSVEEDDENYEDSDIDDSLTGSEFDHDDLNERINDFGEQGDGEPQLEIDHSLWPGDGSVTAAFQSDLQNNLELKNSLEQMIRSNYQHRINQTSASSQEIALSSDSIAFTLIYCSIFLVTLVYIIFKVTLRWRRQRQLDAENFSGYGGNSLPLSHTGNSLCSHAACQRSRILPYSGLGAIWIPEIVNLHTSIVEPVQQTQHQPVHNTSQCNNSCDSCRSLTVPPPSYTKLFLEDCPPEYNDDLVLKSEIAESSAVVKPGNEQDSIVSLDGPAEEMNEEVSNKSTEASVLLPEAEEQLPVNLQPSNPEVSPTVVESDVENVEPLIKLDN